MFDKYKNPLQEGFYKHGSILGYVFFENGDWMISFTGEDKSELFPGVSDLLSPIKDISSYKRNLKKEIGFIESKLEKVSQKA
ncbi:MAG: hypothetical protein KC516_04445 [Nanoarchaeota archaeon]|nr:hypothetical protein [Nanoarchaeota archaeon]